LHYLELQEVAEVKRLNLPTADDDGTRKSCVEVGCRYRSMHPTLVETDPRFLLGGRLEHAEKGGAEHRRERVDDRAVVVKLEAGLP
jgi:hypothetical protein